MDQLCGIGCTVVAGSTGTPPNPTLPNSVDLQLLIAAARGLVQDLRWRLDGGCAFHNLSGVRG